MEKKVINNRYKIVKHLGTGGMGSVYLVEDILYDSTLRALKQIEEGKVNPLTLRSFQNEFKAMTRLKHPNLIQVYDFGFDQAANAYYITIEYVDGYSLQQLHDKQAGATPDQLISIFVDLCRALAFMHSRGIVHRDINPGNIMRFHTGQVKIMDFGLVDIEMDVQRSKGTLAFMAPEVVKGRADFRTDIFSLGLTFYYILTNTYFYGALDSQQIVRLLCSKDAFDQYCTEKLTASFNTDPIRTVIEKMLAFDPENRFQNCTRIIEAVNRVKGTQHPFETVETRDAYVLGAEFVGRENELQRLKELAELPQTTAVWIKGEAGIGKSRLFYEFKNWCQLQTITFLEGTCLESVTKQFGPFLAIINELLLHAPSDLIDRYGPELKKILPDHPRFNEIAVAIIRDPKTDHMIIVKTIAYTIIEAVKHHQHPCVLYLNDMQWSDESSIEVIDTLLKLVAVQNNATRSVHIYLSSRIECSELLENVGKTHPFELIELSVLGAQMVASYIAAVFGKNGIGQHLQLSIKHIHQKVGGNPFFLQELIKSLIATGALVHTQECWDLITPLDQSSIPETLNDFILARLHRLQVSEQQLKALRVIAVLNRSISWQELNGITEVSIDFLQRLVYQEILKTMQHGTHTAYAFAHDLIRDAIIERVSQRPLFHEHVACALEVIHAEELQDYIEEIAYHYYHAKNRAKAISYLKRASDITASKYETNKAVIYCNMALELLTGEDSAEKVEFLDKKADILHLSGKLHQSIAIDHELGLLEDKIENSNRKAFSYYRIAFALTEMGSDSEKIVLYLMKAMNVFVSMHNDEGVADTYNQLGFLYYDLVKDYDKAMDYVNKGVAIAEKNNNTKNIAYLSLTIAEIYEARGDFQKAIDYGTKSLRLLKEIESNIKDLKMKFRTKRNITLVTNLCGFFYACNNEFDTAMKYYDTNIALAESLGLSQLSAFGYIRKAEALFTLKRFSEAKQCCDTAQHYFSEIDNHITLFIGRVTAARVDYAVGNTEAAVAQLQQLLENAKNKYETAKLCYELWRMSRDEHYRTQSLDLYRIITPATPNWLYRKRLQELEENNPSDHVYRKTTIRTNRFSRSGRPYYR